MDQVDFEPAQYYSATTLKGDGHHSEKDSSARSVLYIPFGTKHSKIKQKQVLVFISTYIFGLSFVNRFYNYCYGL